MNNLNFSKLKGADAFFQKCITSFGSMNKNDYEVELLHLLFENGWKNKSDFEVSVDLKIPESKVKRLRYETYLVYEVSDTDLDGCWQRN